MTDRTRTAAVVLAAGAGSRFGGGKLLASIGGRPLLDHVVEAVRSAGLGALVVVLGPDAGPLDAIALAKGATIARNPEPGLGLSSSVRVGLAAIDGLAQGPDGGFGAALILLGDQPRTSVASIAALLAAPVPAGRSIVVPRYRGWGGPNPALLLRPAWALAGGLTGDHGFGPLIADRDELVVEVDLAGDNPDVDTPADLAALAERAWAAKVLANRDQVERIREVPDGPDFYAPVRSIFRADPTRTDDPALDLLLARVEPADRWLDVGAGAGRFALPLARALAPSGGEVVALDASPSMLETLGEIAAEYRIGNVRTMEARWPPDRAAASGFDADVVLIAHVGYDVPEIGPFVDALEAAARRSCLAVMMDQVPASATDPFWPLVHDQVRDPLPALPDFLDLLVARGTAPSVTRVSTPGRTFESRAALAGFVRRQLWIDPAGPSEARFQAALDELIVTDDAGWLIAGRGPNEIGLVEWHP